MVDDASLRVPVQNMCERIVTSAAVLTGAEAAKLGLTRADAV